MTIRKIFATILTAAFILPGSFPVFAAEADRMPEENLTEQESASINDEEITADASLSETAMEPEGGTDFPLPDEAPAFHARIEHRMGYTVIGTFTDFTPDIILIQTLYSLDGETWQTSAENWNLFNLGTDDEYKLNGLQNQPCLFASHEPLKSYIAGEIDCFYLKLRITKENGLSYETQSAAITRGGLTTIPEGTERRAWFSSAIAVCESAPDAPYRYRKYGRYQLTVSADATVKEVSALLPDTLPVEVQLDHGADFIAIGVVDCPVTWKPLSLPQLSPGESITIPDAAEEILVPEGTLIPTPLGTFQLDVPLSLNTPPSTAEVRLVLNVIPDSGNPTGVLRAGKSGLEIAFHHKPDGAASIQAYVLAEGESKWTELSDLPLLEELNQPSTANSGYALVLRNDQEPYRSYLAATDAGEPPTPFFVCLKIEGGIYDGRQLILTWPNTYEQLPHLPEIGGAGGNEGNAGADNKEDSTESGQRPSLPQIPDDDPPKDPSPQTPAPNDNHNEQLPAPASNDNHEESSQVPAPDNSRQKQQPTPTHAPETVSAIPQNPGTLSAEVSVSDFPSDRQEDTFISEQYSNPPQTAPDMDNTSAENSRRIPLLTAIVFVMAGGCIGAVVCKAAGYSLFHRIAVKIRNILHK